MKDRSKESPRQGSFTSGVFVPRIDGFSRFTGRGSVVADVRSDLVRRLFGRRVEGCGLSGRASRVALAPRKIGNILCIFFKKRMKKG